MQKYWKVEYEVLYKNSVLRVKYYKAHFNLYYNHTYIFAKEQKLNDNDDKGMDNFSKIFSTRILGFTMDQTNILYMPIKRSERFMNII